MGTSSSAAQFVGKIRAAEKALADAPKKALKEIGDDMEDAFNAAVRADLSVTGTPQGFKNWVTELQARGKVQGSDTLIFAPYGKSVGPIRVAEQGRNATMRVLGGGASGPVLGQGKISKKTGKALGKAKRWNGSTKGKDTWSDATEAIGKALPKKISKGVVDAMRKVF